MLFTLVYFFEDTMPIFTVDQMFFSIIQGVHTDATYVTEI